MQRPERGRKQAMRNFKELVRTMSQFFALPSEERASAEDSWLNWIIIKPIQGAFAVNLGDHKHDISEKCEVQERGLSGWG
ncbi:hypothetical protein SUGI_1173150 [Cryptomeria japonica]|nr:hypothetical protein SUGI_1173150 [Cryptomeria japonica]